MSELFDWHRAFGMAWSDRLFATGCRVETERDTSIQQQLLDLVIVREGLEPKVGELPDGIQPLAAHTLISFKSHHEAFNRRAFDELISHSVGYRKSLGYEVDEERDFRLLAISARRPTELLNAGTLRERSPGVYSAVYPGLDIRVIAISLLPRTPNNAMLFLFSANDALVAYGQANHRPYSEHTSQLIYELYRNYTGEGIPMPITLEEYVRQINRRIIDSAPVERRLEGLTPEQRLAGLAPEQRLAGLAPEQRLAGLAPEQLLASLTPEQLTELLRLASQKVPPVPPS